MRNRVWTVLAGAAVLALLASQGVRAATNDGRDLRLYREAGARLLAGGFWRDVDWNTWPPFYSVFVAPVAWYWELVPHPQLRLALAYAWNVALLFAFIHVSLRALAPGRRIPALDHFLVFLCATPWIRSNLYFHQINLVPALLCALAFVRLERHRDDPLAGGLLGLAASLKVTPVTLLPYLLRRWRALAVALGAGAICAVIPALVYGPATLVEAWRYWIMEVLPAQPGARGFHNVSLAGALHRFFDARWGEVLKGFPTLVVDLGAAATETLAMVLGFGVLAAMYALVARGPRRPAMLDLALLAPAGVLASTAAWKHHLVVLLPTVGALLLYVRSGDAEPRRRRVATVLATFALALTVVQEIDAIPALFRAEKMLLALGVPTWAGYLAVAALAVARGDRATTAFGAKPAEGPRSRVPADDEASTRAAAA